MGNWLHNLSIFWMTIIVFGLTYVLAASIYLIVIILAKGKRLREFKLISPGLLPPLGVLFGLFVAFTASQVWDDNDHASTAVDREASALKAIVVLADVFPGEPQSHLRTLIRSHINQVVTQEWPMMAHGTATLRFSPRELVQALELTLMLTPTNEGQKIAQREIVSALEIALDARRQRIITSQSQINLVKWFCLFVQAVIALIAIAMIHSENRITTAITVALFATGIAASILIITAHDRPFSGAFAVKPGPLVQVIPEDEV